MKACFTDDSNMGDPTKFQDTTPADLVTYLNANPRNAVVVDLDDRQVAIFRGASEDLDNFYYQDLPLEDPDANGGDLTAQQAVDEVLG